MGTSETRIHKLRWMLAAVRACEEKNKPANKDKLIAEFCFDNGSTRKTALEILKQLADASKIVLINDSVSLVKDL